MMTRWGDGMGEPPPFIKPDDAEPPTLAFAPDDPSL